MKIKIIAQIPVEEHIRPIMGEVYEVMGTETRGRTGEIYFIEVNGERVGVFNHELEIVQEVEA